MGSASMKSLPANGKSCSDRGVTVADTETMGIPVGDHAVAVGFAGGVINDDAGALGGEMPGDGAAGGGRRLHATQRADVEPVADALASLLSSPSLARRMGEAGRHRAEAELSYDALAKRLAVAIDNLR